MTSSGQSSFLYFSNDSWEERQEVQHLLLQLPLGTFRNPGHSAQAAAAAALAPSAQQVSVPQPQPWGACSPDSGCSGAPAWATERHSSLSSEQRTRDGCRSLSNHVRETGRPQPAFAHRPPSSRNPIVPHGGLPCRALGVLSCLFNGDTDLKNQVLAAWLGPSPPRSADLLRPHSRTLWARGSLPATASR